MTQNDQFGESELITAMKSGDKRKFTQLYPKLASTSRVNPFMCSVFTQGENWHANLKQPEFALLKDTSGKTLLHYAAAGGV